MRRTVAVLLVLGLAGFGLGCPISDGGDGAGEVDAAGAGDGGGGGSRCATCCTGQGFMGGECRSDSEGALCFCTESNGDGAQVCPRALCE